MAGPVSDELLMLRLAEDDDRALAELMGRWGATVWHFIDRLCGAAGRTDDVYQEVWTRLYVYRKRFLAYRPFPPYLFQIATNCCRSALARHRRRPVSLDEAQPMAAQLASDDPPPVETLIAEEQRSLLYRAIERLPWMQRVVVTMYCLFSTDYRRIAAALGRSPGTIRSHMHSALKNLRATLERMTQEKVPNTFSGGGA